MNNEQKERAARALERITAALETVIIEPPSAPLTTTEIAQAMHVFTQSPGNLQRCTAVSIRGKQCVLAAGHNFDEAKPRPTNHDDATGEPWRFGASQ